MKTFFSRSGIVCSNIFICCGHQEFLGILFHIYYLYTVLKCYLMKKSVQNICCVFSFHSVSGAKKHLSSRILQSIHHELCQLIHSIYMDPVTCIFQLVHVKRMSKCWYGSQAGHNILLPLLVTSCHDQLNCRL